MQPIRTGLSTDQQRISNVRNKILHDEQQRIELEQRLRAMNSRSSQLHQRKQIQHIQTYFNRLNEQSKQSQQQNLELLHQLTEARQRLDQLHNDAEHLIRLKDDYTKYLESRYPTWQRPMSSSIREKDHLNIEGNLRQSIPFVGRSYDGDSSLLVKRYEDQLKVGLDRSISPVHATTPIESPPAMPTTVAPVDDNSSSESNISRSKRTGSLRMNLTRNGLVFLLDYLEKEFQEAIEKKKFYRLDQPTINQKRTILTIANDRDITALKDLDPTTTSMVVLDQLPSTIRRTTVHQCLFTEEILSANIKDLDRNTVANMLPEEDRSLWLRLSDHFAQILRLHVMNSQTLVEKFTIALLPVNVLYAHEKAKNLLKHLMEKYTGRQFSNSEEDQSIDRPKISRQPVVSNWMKKLERGSILNENDEDESTIVSQRKSASIEKKQQSDSDDDHDSDFFS